MSSIESSGVDVLVVGAGPTGLAMAVELTRMGVRCRVIDKALEPSKTSKVLAVQARTLEYFDRIGIADAAVAEGRPVHGVNVFSDEKDRSHELRRDPEPLPIRSHPAAVGNGTPPDGASGRPRRPPGARRRAVRLHAGRRRR